MFETIYCTRESFENEVEATNQLGWITGEILQYLANEGILKDHRLATAPYRNHSSPANCARVNAKLFSSELVRRAIRTGDVSTLEMAKATLWQPILARYGCMESGAPNSIRTWISSAPTVVASILN